MAESSYGSISIGNTQCHFVFCPTASPIYAFVTPCMLFCVINFYLRVLYPSDTFPPALVSNRLLLPRHHFILSSPSERPGSHQTMVILQSVYHGNGLQMTLFCRRFERNILAYREAVLAMKCLGSAPDVPSL